MSYILTVYCKWLRLLQELDGLILENSSYQIMQFTCRSLNSNVNFVLGRTCDRLSSVDGQTKWKSQCGFWSYCRGFPHLHLNFELKLCTEKSINESHLLWNFPMFCFLSSLDIFVMWRSVFFQRRIVRIEATWKCATFTINYSCWKLSKFKSRFFSVNDHGFFMKNEIFQEK